MIFVALASDYDGTLAQDGVIDAATRAGLERLKAFGKKIILVTGRELPDLRKAFEPLKLFDAVVAENGAVLFLPSSGEERLICAAPPPALVAALKQKRVQPLAIGQGIIATWSPNESIVLQTIRELGLDWQVIFNKGAVMCLPPGVNKASGLDVALEMLGLSPFNVVAIGDAENDLAFLKTCGCAVAVGNAIDTVKANADIITTGERGAGVCELIDQWRTDAIAAFGKVRRHDLYLGDSVLAGERICLRSDAGAILIAGSSGVGKSRLATLLLERITERGYQVCVLDPEGDYDALENLAHVGDPERTPAPNEAVGLLQNPRTSLSVNLLGTEVSGRPVYFAQLWGQLHGLRTATGRPHWIVLDETHHLSPHASESHEGAVSLAAPSVILLTARPDSLSLSALKAVRTLIAVGDVAHEVIGRFCKLVGKKPPASVAAPSVDEVLYWECDGEASPQAVAIGKARQVHRRHTRKYAEGSLGEDKSFYFRGAAQKLNLRARNLAAFMQMAQGVDDETWLFHLRQGDYTRWFRDSIKDDELAAEVEPLEVNLDALQSRSMLFDAVKRRYAAADIDG
jgi:phosphoglycolate phosphatase (TIGR01487 family)